MVPVVPGHDCHSLNIGSQRFKKGSLFPNGRTDSGRKRGAGRPVNATLSAWSAIEKMIAEPTFWKYDGLAHGSENRLLGNWGSFK